MFSNGGPRSLESNHGDHKPKGQTSRPGQRTAWPRRPKKKPIAYTRHRLFTSPSPRTTSTIIMFNKWSRGDSITCPCALKWRYVWDGGCWGPHLSLIYLELVSEKKNPQPFKCVLWIRFTTAANEENSDAPEEGICRRVRTQRHISHQRSTWFLIKPIEYGGGDGGGDVSVAPRLCKT